MKEEVTTPHLTAKVSTPYASNRGLFMSVDAPIHPEIKTDATMKVGEGKNGEQTAGKWEGLPSIYFRRKKAAKEWEDALKNELRGQQINKNRLLEIISAGIGPGEWKAKHQKPGDIQHLPQDEKKIRSEWRAHQKSEQALPKVVAERMQKEGARPKEVRHLHEEHDAFLSPGEFQVLDAVSEGIKGIPFTEIPLDQQKEIAEQIAKGLTPTEALFHVLAPELEAYAEEEERTEQASAYEDETRGEVSLEEKQQDQVAEDENSKVPEVFTEAFAKEDREKEELRAAWYNALSEEDVQNQDTRSTIEAAVALGIRPNESRSKGAIRREAKEVFEQAAAEDETRKKDIIALLEQMPDFTDERKKFTDLTEDEKVEMAEEIVRIHHLHEGEEGKIQAITADGEEVKAGVYNLKREQLRERVEQLERLGLSSKQRRLLIEAGIVAPVNIDPARFDPAAFPTDEGKVLAEFAQRGIKDGTQINDTVLRQLIEILQEKEKNNMIQGTRTPEEIRDLFDYSLEALRTVKKDASPEEWSEEIKRHLSLTLLPKEINLIGSNKGEGAIDWLNREFDFIYSGAQSGQELDSVSLKELDRKVAAAHAFLKYEFKDRPEQADQFFNLFTIRQKLMIMRVVIGQRNKESLQGAAGQLRDHGLLSSFGFEDQNVRRMFTRISEKIEDMRLNKTIGKMEKRITSEMIREMQQQIQEEEEALLDNLKESSPFWQSLGNKVPEKIGDETEEQAKMREAKNAITRATRMAYDLFVSSQREALHVARGRHPKDDSTGYRSVPSGVFSYFNYEAMMWGGWDMKNAEAMRFFDAMKVDIAEEALLQRGLSKDALDYAQKMEYGYMQYKELSPIADFFSSGWRRGIMQENLENVMVFKYIAKPTIDKWRSRYTGITKSQINDLLNERTIVLDGKVISAKENMAELEKDDEATAEARKKDAKLLAQELADLRRNFRGRNAENAPDDIKEAVRLGKDKAKDFGLFFQLHASAGSSHSIRKNKKGEREKAHASWEKIAKSKPEEIIRILKDRLPMRKIGPAPTPSLAGHDPDHEIDNEKELAEGGHDDRPWHDELQPLNQRLAEIMGLGQEYWDPNHAATVVVRTEENKDTSFDELQETAFDAFRKKYGKVVVLLRENAMQKDIPDTVDMTNLTVPEKELVAKAFAITDEDGKIIPQPDEAQKLMAGYRAMQEYISRQQVYDPLAKRDTNIIPLLTQDYRFEDIYNKVLSLEDTFLDELENPPKLTGIRSVSDRISTDPAAGGFRRTMNDAMDAMAAQDGFYKFLTEEKPEAKMEGAQQYAKSLGSANGQEDIARAIRFTYGSYLDLMKPYYFLDVVGLKRLGNIPIAPIQKIYGPEAHVMEREELRRIIDSDLRFLLASSAGKAEERDQILYERGQISAEELELRREHYLHTHEEALDSLKKRVGVRTKDIYKQRALQGMLFLLIFLAGSALAAATAVATEQSTGGQGGGGGGGGHH